MSEFTKGPWSNDDYIINAKDCCIEIAKVTVFNQGKANANLIAAAPEMHEVLQSIINTWDGPLYRHEMAPNIDKAREALAKARGEL